MLGFDTYSDIWCCVVIECIFFFTEELPFCMIVEPYGL